MSPHRPRADDLSASIMCSRLGELANEVRKLEAAGIDSIHVDVMDGHFVPNLTFGPDVVAVLRRVTRLPLHVHMMVSDAGAFVRRFAEAGADTFYFHIEAERYPWRLAGQIEEAGMTPGIALNPSTAVDLIRHIDVPHVLVMAVEPGFAGQRWLPPTVDRVRELSQISCGQVGIGVDGNVSPENAALAKAAGASLFVCGTSSLFSGGDYASEVRRMRTSLGSDDSPSRHRAT
jgi:ribulose-phosphate 3-epimerase